MPEKLRQLDHRARTVLLSLQRKKRYYPKMLRLPELVGNLTEKQNNRLRSSSATAVKQSAGFKDKRPYTKWRPNTMFRTLNP